MSAPLRLEPGAVFARDFLVLKPLAQGGMGAVYEVEQRSTGKKRALKLMHPQLVEDAHARARFALEARIGAQIDSDHVVEVVGAGIDDETGAPWLAMELLEGEDLAHTLKSRERLPPSEVLEVFAQLGDALGKAHAQGIVHRDLKPENLFIATSRRRGVPFTVKVLDFGIARLIPTDRTGATATSAIGSPYWMAPEQASAGAHLRPATDVWALGLIAFRVLTGRNYWRAANTRGADFAALLTELLMAPLPPASARATELGRPGLLPASFDAWFARCVVRDPAARFPSATHAVAALEVVLAPAPSPSAPSPPAPSLPATVALSMPPLSVPPTAPGTAPHGPSWPSVPPTAPQSAPSPAWSSEARLAAHLAHPSETTAFVPPPRPSGKSPLVALSAGAAVLLSLGGVGAALWSRRGRATASPEAETTRAERPVVPAPAGRESNFVSGPPPPAESPLRCAPPGTPRRVGETAALGGQLVLEPFGDTLGLGWVVPPRARRRLMSGHDDAAALELQADGAIARVIDPEEQDQEDWQVPVNYVRVSPVPGRGGRLVVQIDQDLVTETGSRAASCGDTQGYYFLAAEPGSDGFDQHRLDAMFDCRTIVAPRPFVLGVRAELRGGALERELSVIATRSRDPSRAPSVWRLPIDVRRVLRSAEPTRTLRRYESPDGIDGLPVPGVGYAVALRYKQRIYVGWLSENLRATTALARLESLGGEPGRPRLAWNGREALVVFPDRASVPRRTPTPAYELYAARFALGQVPTAGVRLPTSGPHEGDEFAASAAALGDGSWLVTWSEGPTELRRATDSQRVMLRRYAPDLTPGPDAVLLSGGDNASDARVATLGDRYVVAMMQGRSSTRRVVTVSGTCALLNAPGAR